MVTEIGNKKMHGNKKTNLHNKNNVSLVIAQNGGKPKNNKLSAFDKIKGCDLPISRFVHEIGVKGLS